MGVERWRRFNWQKSRGTHRPFWSSVHLIKAESLVSAAFRWSFRILKVSPLSCEGLVHYQVSAARNPFILSLTVLSSNIFLYIQSQPLASCYVRMRFWDYGIWAKFWASQTTVVPRQWVGGETMALGRPLSGLRGGVIEAFWLWIHHPNTSTIFRAVPYILQRVQSSFSNSFLNQSGSGHLRNGRKCQRSYLKWEML